jgi:O-antigen biosynthesis protein WbqP
MKRFLDLCISLSLLTLSLPLLLIVGLAVKLTSPGPVLYWSDRVGRDNVLFRMPKFRTMRVNTPEVATHLLADSYQYLTPVGLFLRKYSLDELPQLWSVAVGDMSLVGPRPALFNQDDLINLRTEKKVSGLQPGITGWAQINGRDSLPISKKVLYDEHYLNNQSIWFDLKVLFKTAFGIFRMKGI